MLDAESPDVPNYLGEPRQGLQSIHRQQQVREVFTLAVVDAALSPKKPVLFEDAGDVAIGLQGPLRVMLPRVRNGKIEGNREH